MRKLTKLSIEESTNEIIQPVTNRVVPIALVTSRQLILKDFALESNAAKMEQGIQFIVQSLASNLSMITCKEPLKQSMGQKFHQLIKKKLGLQELPSEFAAIIEQLVNQNLNAGCLKIQNEIKQKALEEIKKDEALARALQIRKSDSSFKDTSRIYLNQFLPEVLKPKHNGLTDLEFQVYQDFENVPDYFLNEIEMQQRPQVNYSNDSLEEIFNKFFTLLENMEISNQEESFSDLLSEVTKRLEKDQQSENQAKIEFFKRLFRQVCEKYK